MTQEQRFTVIDDGRVCETDACVEAGHVRLSPDAVHASLGWELKPQGLCRGDVCVPLTGAHALRAGEALDLEALAALLGRPLALDVEERVAVLGASAAARAAQLDSMVAPDFALPDLSGRRHALSEFRGKKVLLVAYASW